jgi:hypothetical protein
VRLEVLSAECRVLRERMPRRLGGPQHSALSTQHFVALALLVFLASPAFGCPVCWGSPDDPMVKSANNGIWVLLGVVAFVQVGLVAMFWSFWRHAREQRRFRESLRVIEGGPHS